MSKYLPQNWLNTKEVLSKTGISRATLNNYIKLGIIPKPLVEKPREGAGGAKRIGYFPYEVLDRIHLVRILKREGNSMEIIAEELKDVPIGGHQKDDEWGRNGVSNDSSRFMPGEGRADGEVPKLTLSDMPLPCYLLDYRFSVVWMNQHAEQEIFSQRITVIRGAGSRSIFKFLFGWEFHSRVRNWRDMVAFHLSFVKMKYTKEWMANLYQGISEKEVRVLQEIYDEIPTFRREFIKDKVLNLLMETGNTRSYKVYTISFKEGMLFLYRPWNVF